jgi:hypothetical protein
MAETATKKANLKSIVSVDVSERTRLIRETAYYKWLAAGSPPSDGVEFWLAAETEVSKKGKTQVK